MNVNSSTFQQQHARPIDRVFNRVNYEQRSALSSKEFKLETIRLILSRLQDPHDHLNIIHVAGTKGKGSTATFLAKIGTELGLKTAVYSSPHFESYCERFTIDNQLVSEEKLNPVLDRVLSVVEQMDQEISANELKCRSATFFDISTAAAMLLFAEEEAELVVLEVGLGGRLDSTNVCDPLATLITSISLDHTKQLGHSTVEIAGEKAAIIKSPVPAICGSVTDDVFEVIQKRADSQSAKVFRLGRDFDYSCSSANRGTLMFNYVDSEAEQHFEALQIPGLGQHQCHNAALSIKTIHEILPKIRPNPNVDFQSAVRNALSSTHLKGRLEVISHSPWVIVDMAHNEASIRAMLRCFADQKIVGKKQAIFSCSSDKEHISMLEQMLPYFDRLYLTEFQSNPRAQCRERLIRDSKTIVDSHDLNVELESNLLPQQALHQAINQAGDYELTVVCGSIFLVGELMPPLNQLLGRSTSPK